MATAHEAEPASSQRRRGLRWFSLALGINLALLGARSAVSAQISYLGLFEYFNPHRQTSAAEAWASERDAILFNLLFALAPTAVCLIVIYLIGRRTRLNWIAFHSIAVNILVLVALPLLLLIGPFASYFWLLIGVQVLTGILIPRPPSRGHLRLSPR